ncbi:hypothetical protein STUTZSP0542_28690 [Stutzerimonas marianensis]
MAIARIVDQHIHGAVLGLHLGDHRVDDIEVGHIQQHSMGPLRRQRLEGCSGGFTANSADYSMALAERFFGQGLTEAAADARNKQGFDCIHGSHL